jgi:8-oxo-dGTP pyrophosphatase MutT (NUDIX family)
MNEVLTEFLTQRAPAARQDLAWFDGALKLELQVFITAELPPLEYITSVRAVLFAAGRCAVLRNVDGMHVLPGGRREDGEPLDATLQREVMEETGCTLESITALGVLHFRHLTPRPADYKYPYPDFFQVVFVARGRPTEGFAGDPEHYETMVDFKQPVELDQIELPPYQRVLLAAAMRLLG